MTLKKENAAPDVVVGAATGQHLCNSEISIPNDASASNEKIAVPEAHQGSNSVAPNPDLIESGVAEDIEKNLEKSSLQEVSMTELYDRVYEPKAPVVEGLLYPGTYIFAGSPKVGKSFFMAQLAYHVAAGIPLWEYPVRQGSVLYLALEDDYARLQKRLSRMFDVEGTDSLYLATDARSMADGLEAQMEQFITRHPDTVLIIIDTLQRIRELSGEQYSYAKDYEVIKSLKAFADKHGIRYESTRSHFGRCIKLTKMKPKEEAAVKAVAQLHRFRISSGYPGPESGSRAAALPSEVLRNDTSYWVLPADIVLCFLRFYEAGNFKISSKKKGR